MSPAIFGPLVERAAKVARGCLLQRIGREHEMVYDFQRSWLPSGCETLCLYNRVNQEYMYCEIMLT